jgi:hypothetical protein
MIRFYNYGCEEIKSGLNSSNACHHLVQKLLSSHFVSNNVSTKVSRIIIFPLFSMDLKLHISLLGGECNLRICVTGPTVCFHFISLNPLTLELNPSVQHCRMRFFLLGIFLLESCILLIYVWKTNKCNNYSFSVLILYGSSYMFRHYIAILREHF